MQLFPRDEKFFALLEEQSDLLVKGARALDAGVRAGPLEMAQAAGVIRQIENDADEITHRIMTRLHQTFVTPMDAEDLHAITSSLDDVLDCIEDSAFRLSSYGIDPIPPGVLEFTQIIDACANRLQAAVRKLRAGKPLRDECIEVNRLENTADELMRRLVTDLFRSNLDAISLIKLKEVYE